MNLDFLKEGEVAPKPPKPKSQLEIIKGWVGKDDKPLVSILCHSYNHEKYIKDALNGFLMQKTDFAWEVIVHDDASTDQSVEIIKKYAELYPKLIKPIFQKENQFSQGLKPSFFSTKAAKGEFFAFCEGDDYWLDERKLQTQADFLLSNPCYSVCGHDAFVFEGDRIVKKSKLSERSKVDISSDKLSKGWFILTLTAMFRRGYDLFPEEQMKTLNGDAFMFSRLGRIGGYKFMVDIYPAAYRVHAGGVWSRVDQQHRLAHSMNSFYWMSQYYKRVGDKRLSAYYAQRSALKSLDGGDPLSLKELILFNYYLVKQVFRKKFGSLHRLVSSLKNR